MGISLIPWEYANKFLPVVANLIMWEQYAEHVTLDMSSIAETSVLRLNKEFLTLIVDNLKMANAHSARSEPSLILKVFVWILIHFAKTLAPPHKNARNATLDIT